MNPADFISERVIALGQLALPSVRPLAVPDDHGDELLAVGSCVLLWYNGHRYIVTAAHVVEHYPDRNVTLGTATKWVDVPHPWRLLKKEGPGGDSDTIDLAIRRIPPELADSLDGCRFLTAINVSHGDVPAFAAPTRSKYTALGWPQNQLNYRRSARYTAPKNLAFTGAIASPAEYSSIGLDPRTHVVIEFDRQNVIGVAGPQTAPAIAGVSGGGLFRMPGLERPGDLTQPTLVAITIQQDPMRKLLFGSKVGALFRSLEAVRDETIAM